MTTRTTDGHYIKKLGRYKMLYLSRKGWFFLWNDRRFYLDDVARLPFPVTYYDNDGKLVPIGGWLPLCNWGGVLVEITEYDTIQLWDEIK